MQKGDSFMKLLRFQKKRVYFQPQKVSVLFKIGVFFSLEISEKGSFFKGENTDGFHVLHSSGIPWWSFTPF